jgi:hypothetical protein
MNSRIETDGGGLGGFTVIAVDPPLQAAAGHPSRTGSGHPGAKPNADTRKALPDHLAALRPPAGLLLAGQRGNPRPTVG